MGSYRYRRSIYLMEALHTLNSPPVVSFHLGLMAGLQHWMDTSGS